MDAPRMNAQTQPAISVAALTGGSTVPSARFRIRQLIGPLAAEGISMREWHTALSAYPPQRRSLRPLWLAGNLMQRLPQVLRTRGSDAVILQRELISTIHTLEGLTARPRILDVDDAIWLHTRGLFTGKLAASCDAIMAGNAFLADYYARYNHRVWIVPTAVDTDRYVPAAPARSINGDVTVGWVGTSQNYRFLKAIEPALRTFLRRMPHARLHIMSDRPPALPSLPPGQVRFEYWNPEAELSMIQGLTVGIMPLQDSDWTRGKCSLKMLTYLSCGIPAVVSPVGMNTEVLERAECGVAAAGEADWVDALTWLCDDPGRREAMGARGREIVETYYSVNRIVPRVAGILRGVIKGP